MPRSSTVTNDKRSIPIPHPSPAPSNSSSQPESTCSLPSVDNPRRLRAAQPAPLAVATASPLAGLFRSLDNNPFDAKHLCQHPSPRQPAEATAPSFRRRAMRPPSTAAKPLAVLQNRPRRASTASNAGNRNDSDLSEREDDAEQQRDFPAPNKSRAARPIGRAHV